MLKIYRSLPMKIRKMFNNRFTLALYKYFILRPAYLKPSMRGITIELTDRCNMRCSYCPKDAGTGSDGGDMDFSLYKAIIDQALKFPKMDQVCLVGFGEPLLYPDLIEAISYIKKKNRKIRVSITTNVTLLTGEYAHRFIECGLDQITLSINAASRAQYKSMNLCDLYDKVVDNSKAFLEIINKSNSSMRVTLQVLSGLNGPDEINAFQRYWKPFLGRRGGIQAQPFVNWAGMVDAPKTHTQKIIERYPCAHLQGSCIITKEGDLLACCMALPGRRDELTLGNIKEKTLERLLSGNKIVQLRKLNLDNRLWQLNCCEKCDAYKTAHNVWFKNPFYKHFGRRWF